MTFVYDSSLSNFYGPARCRLFQEYGTAIPGHSNPNIPYFSIQAVVETSKVWAFNHLRVGSGWDLL